MYWDFTSSMIVSQGPPVPYKVRGRSHTILKENHPRLGARHQMNYGRLAQPQGRGVDRPSGQALPEDVRRCQRLSLDDGPPPTCRGRHPPGPTPLR